ncbi:MAG: hypothetical protein AAB367_02435 [Patescibacteria group bacterium]
MLVGRFVRSISRDPSRVLAREIVVDLGGLADVVPSAMSLRLHEGFMRDWRGVALTVSLAGAGAALPRVAALLPFCDWQ